MLQRELRRVLGIGSSYSVTKGEGVTPFRWGFTGVVNSLADGNPLRTCMNDDTENRRNRSEGAVLHCS